MTYDRCMAVAGTAAWLALATVSLACENALEEFDQRGVQEQLREFKVGARAELASVDAKLKRVEARPVRSTLEAKKSAEKLRSEYRELKNRLDALAIDPKSRWDETLAKLDAEIDELARKVDAVLDARQGEPDAR